MTRRALLSLLLTGLVALPAEADARLRLNPLEQCTVQVLNRTVKVDATGRWELTGVPAGGGQVRVRLHCSDGLVQRTAQSAPFVIQPNVLNAIAELEFSEPQPGPKALVATPSATLFTDAGQLGQLVVTGVYPDGGTKDLSLAASGTSYLTTNPAVLVVDPDGGLVAQASGVVVITATNEGVSVAAVLQVQAGPDTDEDGLPDDWENAVGLDPEDPTDALADNDSDNLVNLEEFGLGTDPFLADTDGDTLPDGEEASEGKDGWVTSPVLADTDGDLVSDSLELATGTNPTDPDSVDFGAVLVGLEPSADSVLLVINPLVGEATVQVGVMGLAIDGTGIPLTDHPSTTWTTADPAVAIPGAVPGEIVGTQNGQTTITVAFDTLEASIATAVQTFNPVGLSNLPLGCEAHGVALAGDRVAVACDDGDLKVVSIAPPVAPQITATVEVAPELRDVAVAGSVAWVAARTAGLKAVDLGAVGGPTVIGQTGASMPGDAQAVAIEGGLAVVALGASGHLRMVDISLPTLPQPMGQVGLAHGVFDVALSGNLAVGALLSQGVRVVDVSVPAAPVHIGTVYGEDFPGSAKAVAMSPEWVFIATGQDGLAVVDLSDPTTPEVVLSTTGPGEFMLLDVALQGTLLFGADVFRVNSVPILQVVQPLSPVFASLIEFAAFDDDNGFAIDANSTMVALLAGHSVPNELYIGQYDKLVDSSGVPPTCVITAPISPSTHIEGQLVSVQIQSVDDVHVQSVQVVFDGVPVTSTASPPYIAQLQMPLGVTDPGHLIEASALDLGGNVGECAPVYVTVAPDPGTTVQGAVIEEPCPAGSNDPCPPIPVPDAIVQVVGHPELEATTAVDGTFLIGGVPSANPILLMVTGELSTGFTALDIHGSFVPVPDAITDVGDLLLKSKAAQSIGAGLLSRPVAFRTDLFDAHPHGVVGAGLVSRAIGFHTTLYDAHPHVAVGAGLLSRAVGFHTTLFDAHPFETVGAGLLSRAVGFRTDLYGGALDTEIGAGLLSRPFAFITDLMDVPPPSTVATGLTSRPYGFYAQPHVLSVSPATASIAASPLALTVEGVGLYDASAAALVDAQGAPLAGATITILDTSADGRTLSATLTLGALTPSTTAIVVVTALDGATIDWSTGTNSLEVVP